MLLFLKFLFLKLLSWNVFSWEVHVSQKLLNQFEWNFNMLLYRHTKTCPKRWFFCSQSKNLQCLLVSVNLNEPCTQKYFFQPPVILSGILVVKVRIIDGKIPLQDFVDVPTIKSEKCVPKARWIFVWFLKNWCFRKV